MDHNIILSDRCIDFLIHVLNLAIDQCLNEFSNEELEDDAFYHSLRKVAIHLMLAKNHEKEFIDCCQELISII